MSSKYESRYDKLYSDWTDEEIRRIKFVDEAMGKLPAIEEELAVLKVKVARLEEGMREIYSRLELALKELKLLGERMEK